MKAIRHFANYLLNHWYRKFSYLFAAGIVLFWINCLGDYWWEETFVIVRALLLTTVIIAILIPWRALSLPLQFAALIAVNIRYGDLDWDALAAVGEEEQGRIAFWLSWVWELLLQMTPIVWISVGVWIIVQAAVAMGTQRKGVILFAGGSLLTLLVADSLFTPIILWGEVAAIVALCLAWLVANHLVQFKKHHPDSWYEMLKYPLSLFLPMLLVIAVVIGAGLFVPAVDPLLKDPYTIWKESRGEAVPSYIGDKIGTEIAPPAKAADAKSGYSRNDTQLGGGFQFDYSPVMEVTTSKRSYWRGETKARYTGQGWEEAGVEKKEESYTAVGAEQPLPRAFESPAETVTVDQIFTMLREEDRYPVLFGAAPINKVMSLEGSVPSLIWKPESWEMHLKKAAHLNSYTIQSEVAVLDENILLHSTMDQLDVDADYLELPRNLPDRVRELAREITAEANTPYEQARAIERYLRANYRYTNEPDLSKRRSEDFVDSFLFEVQEGYCDYFSTSMAVLARAAGIPTRWVKGYSSGVRKDGEFLRMQGEAGGPGDNEGQGTYTVRNSDAHSWVEAYFPGYGWLPFEPTAGFSYPYLEAAHDPAVQEKQEEEQVQPAAPAVETNKEEGNSFPAAAVTAGAVLLLLAAVAVWRFRAIAEAWRQYRDRTRTANERIVRETNRLLKYCRRKGLEREQQETVREAVVRWTADKEEMVADFHDVLSLFERALYSGQTMNNEDVRKLESHVQTIRGRMAAR